jgi:hypothetical protein
MPANTIQVAYLKYPIDSQENNITLDPPLTNIITLPNTNATLLLFPGNTTLTGWPECCFVLAILSEETGLISVARGVNGSAAANHFAGDAVFAGDPIKFIDFDPVGTCTPDPAVTPQLCNQLSGGLWYCDASTSTWTKQSY